MKPTLYKGCILILKMKKKKQTVQLQEENGALKIQEI